MNRKKFPCSSPHFLGSAPLPLEPALQRPHPVLIRSPLLPQSLLPLRATTTSRRRIDSRNRPLQFITSRFISGSPARFIADMAD